MKTKLSEKEAAMDLQKMNHERKLLTEQEERATQFRKAREEQLSLLNQLSSANSTVTGLGKELRSEKRLVEELKSEIDRLQSGLTNTEEDKEMLEEKLKEKLDLIEELEFKNLSSIYEKAKANLAEAKSEIKGLKEEIFTTPKEQDLKNFVVDYLNARVDAFQQEYNDLKLSSEKKAASDA
ncbi:hypothetical protein HHK36_006148 [Tetracentron sinense]|uniref:Uncharacterized protein n=1 Tax=Tetracentron sinense TaxID=13715 RepID=A0A834ZGP8_TETSI|nr:hypothetical protein HHK36_006148 [Tetracentron sinense]